MTPLRHAGWGAIALAIAAAPAGAQTAMPPLPAVGTVFSYTGTVHTVFAGKAPVEADYATTRRVTEAGPDWFKVEYEMPVGDKKMHYREKHSADPFAPPLAAETVLLTAQGEPVIAGASLTLTQRSGGEVTGSLYPLEIGKTAQYRYAGVSKSGEVPGTRDCKAENRVKVTVPMGSYDAFSVRCKTQISLSSDVRLDVDAQTQYAPDLGVVVSAQTHTVVTRGEEAKVLSDVTLEYKLAQIEKPPAK